MFVGDCSIKFVAVRGTACDLEITVNILNVTAILEYAIVFASVYHISSTCVLASNGVLYTMK